MFKEIIKPLFSLPFRTLGIIFNTFFLFCKKPFYYSKELLNILNSFFLHLTNQESFTKKISRKVDGVNFIFEFDLDPIILSMFLDSYEIELRNCLINYLKKGGIFIDVGASIGYISAIGAGLVGSKGEVHSFEPVPEFFRKLLLLTKINKNFKIYPNNLALGEFSGTADINITNLRNIGWNTMVPGMMRGETIGKTIKTTVKRLDEYIFENEISTISLIKYL